MPMSIYGIVLVFFYTILINHSMTNWKILVILNIILKSIGDYVPIANSNNSDEEKKQFKKSLTKNVYILTQV